MTNEIILLDNLEDITKLDNYIKNPNSKKICFNYNSYRILNKKGITCTYAEDYFNEQDQILLDKLTIEITNNWYKNKDVSKFLEYHEINIGRLLEIELMPYFCKEIKKFIGIFRIIEKENPNKIITSSLGNFVFPIKNEFNHINFPSQKNSSLYYDIIEIPIEIGFKIIILKISRENYQRLKKIVDAIVSLLQPRKFNLNENSSKKNILLVEFNPAIYKNMLQKFSQTNFNLILLNQRVPVITDLNSLKIIKNTNCKLINLEKVHDKIKVKIKNDQKLMKQNIKLLLSYDIFEKIFSFNNNSFWNCIKDDFYILLEKRYSELIRKIIISELFFDNAHIDLVLDWAHTATEEKILTHFATKKNIPIITLQHGIYPTNEKFGKYLVHIGLIPNGNKIVVWGNAITKYILKYYNNQSHIINIGSPKHDKYFMHNSKNKTNYVLIILSELFHSNFEGTNSKTMQRLDEYIKKTYEIIKKVSNKKIIVKFRSRQSSFDGHQLINDLDPNISTYQSRDIFDVINMCDTVIVFNFSTTILDAMIMKKPTMTILPENQGFEDDVIMKSGATLVVNNLNELETKLVDILTNDKLREKLVEDGQKIVNEYFINQGNASEELCKFFDSIL